MRWWQRPEAALFALVLGACAFFYQAGGWNQNSRFDLTRAIVEDGSSRIDRLAANTGDLSRKVPLAAHAELGARGRAAYRAGFRRLPSEAYCDKAPGLSWLAIPAYAAARAAGASLDTAAWACAVLACGVPTAIAAVLLALLLRAWGARPGLACAGAAASVLATLAWPYATLFYGHQAIAAALAIGFALVAIPRARGEHASPARLVVAGAVLGYAVVIEYPALLACLVIGGYVLATGGVRRAAWLAAGAVPPAIALVAYHALVFGGPLAFPYDFSTQPHRSMGVFMGLGAPDPGALWHILVSPYRGLFYATPWLLLAIPGGVVLWRRGRRAEVIACAAIALLLVWLNASLVDWQGGWAMGPRYLVPCLPFVALLACGGVLARRVHVAAIAVALALVAYSGFNMLVGTSVKPEVPVVVRAPYADYLYPRFFAGKLAVSTQGIDMIGHPDRGPRRAWNVGQQLGLPGAASLAPLVIWVLVGAATVRHRARREIIMER